MSFKISQGNCKQMETFDVALKPQLLTRKMLKLFKIRAILVSEVSCRKGYQQCGKVASRASF